MKKSKLFRGAAVIIGISAIFLAFQNFTRGPKPTIGAYEDGDSGQLSPSNPTKEQNLEAFENYLGKPKNSMYGFDYGNNSSWSAFEGGIGWAVSGWHTANPSRQMIWSIPLTMNGVPLSDVANGTGDSSFLHAAQTIAQYYPNAIIRIGWEFNGSWQPWCAAGHQQDYINAFRRVVGIFRGVSSGFSFDWCPNEGTQAVDPSTAYPGDDVVDFIGFDYYDDNWGTPEQRWSYKLTEPNGLEWHAAFAAAHKKPLSFPEFGAGKGGDNPYFIQQMYAWINAHNVAYADYWDATSAYNGEIHNNQYPNIGQSFSQTFGTLLSAGGGGSKTAIVSIQNVNSGLCFADPGGNATLGTQLRQGGCSAGNHNQEFKVSKNGDGSYRFQNVTTGLCMNLAGGSATDGTKIVVWTCTPGDSNSNFQAVADGVGSYVLHPVTTGNGKCVDIPGGSKVPGALIEEWTCNGYNSQQFNLIVRSGSLP